MVKFTEDTVVVPRESEWFGFYGEDGKAIVPLENSPLYTEDWLGLKAMNEVSTDSIPILLSKVSQSTVCAHNLLRLLVENPFFGFILSGKCRKCTGVGMLC
jgi:hypothetical protein